MSTSQSSLALLSDQMADAVSEGAAAIVAVHARPRLPSTGIHWRNGVVVTTEGTVRRDDGVQVTLPNGKAASATLVGRDRATDLAVLTIAEGLLPEATLGDTATLVPGHLVFALARLDAAGPRAASGVVSAVGGKWRCWKGGEIDRYLQSDVSLYPGFGGGPLVDVAGRIHGVNSGGLSRPMTTTIPVETVNRVVGQLLSRGYVARGWLGAALQPVRWGVGDRSRLGVESDGGLAILSLEANGPASLAGLIVGDVLMSLSGRPVSHPDQVIAALSGDVVGRTVEAMVLRGGVPTRIEVLIGERPRRRG